MVKIAVMVLVGLLLVGGVSASLTYSNPTYSNGDIIIMDEEKKYPPIKEQISKEEWNNIFEDYRNGDISKSDAVEILKGVKL